MIIILIVGLVVLIQFLMYQFKRMKLLKRFDKGNVIVFGNKGKGKDLVFQKVIKWRKKDYFSNLDYGKGFRPISLSEIDVNNDFNNFIKEKINQTEKRPDMEGVDIYISDSGIYLPSQFDTTLHKTYKGLPIYYALSRQLYANNVHTNVQNLEREWKALREMGDTYIWCRNTIKIFGYLVTECYIYEKYETALNRTLPLATNIFDKDDNLSKKQFDATNGSIEKILIFNRIKSLDYDTRAFSKKIFY